MRSKNGRIYALKKRSHICVRKTVAFADIIRIYKHICAFKTAECASGKVRGNSNRVSLSLLHFFALSSSRPINFSNWNVTMHWRLLTMLSFSSKCQLSALSAGRGLVAPIPGIACILGIIYTGWILVVRSLYFVCNIQFNLKKLHLPIRPFKLQCFSVSLARRSQQRKRKA